jgi:hypothetical protein
MGGIVTKLSQNEKQADRSPLWYASEDAQQRKVVRLDPTMPPLEDKDHIQLYNILKEPVTQRAIGKFAVSKKNDYLLMCWAEIEEFKEEEIEELRETMMVEMYDAYIKPGSSMQIMGLSKHVIDTYTLQHLSSKKTSENLSSKESSLKKSSDSQSQDPGDEEKLDACPSNLDNSTFAEVKYPMLCYVMHINLL